MSRRDRAVLRELADRVAAVAARPCHDATRAEWRRLNGLKPGRPLVWINEIPWHEMDVDGELTLLTSHSFCREVEWELRSTLYQWEHMPADMVVDPIFYSPLVIHDSGYGIHEQSDTLSQDEAGGILSWGFHPVIQEEKDLDKIRPPRVTHDDAASNAVCEALVDLFGDILEVRRRGIVHTWFAPWDELIRWWGVQEALADLVNRPEMVHRAMEILTECHMARMRQWEDLNLLSVTDGNHRVGSGGPGCTDELPGAGFDPGRIRPEDQWGCAAAQIFSAVSPRMHEEFALRYERRWLERFGLTYYGCCDPLHHKLDILSSIPNLRKVSMSPWADLEKGAERMGDRYVFSYKPTPAIFAEDVWNPDQARSSLREALEKTRGCIVEVIMKDISTVRHEPQRLWEWATMAEEETARLA